MGEAYRTVIIRLTAIAHYTLKSINACSLADRLNLWEECGDTVLAHTVEATRNADTFRRMADAINKKV